MKQNRMKYVSERDEKSQIVPGHKYLYDWVMSNVKKGETLDIGCWNGHLELLFKDSQHHITGIDLEEEPLRFARKKFKKYSFIQADISKPLSFKSKSFNTVLYFMVLEHIPKGTELQSLKNINKVLKKNGLLFMNTMNDTFLSNLLDPAYIFGHRHYSEKRLRSFLKKAGFEIKEIHYNAGFYTTLHIFLLYFFKHILRRSEPRNAFLDRLMMRDYRNKGFAEIDILAKKVKDL